MVPPGDTPLEIGTETLDEAVVLSVTGEIDLVSGPLLEEAGRRQLEKTPSALVLDLNGVTFLSSAGLTVLVRLRNASRGHTDLRVVATNSAALRPLQLMGLDQEFAMYRTRDDALAT